MGHRYREVNFDYDDEGGVIDPVWLLTICFALGIWLVFNRYQSLLNRAIFFRLPPPPVRVPRLISCIAPLCSSTRASAPSANQRDLDSAEAA